MARTRVEWSWSMWNQPRPWRLLAMSGLNCRPSHPESSPGTAAFGNVRHAHVASLQDKRSPLRSLRDLTAGHYYTSLRPQAWPLAQPEFATERMASHARRETGARAGRLSAVAIGWWFAQTCVPTVIRARRSFRFRGFQVEAKQKIQYVSV